MKKLLLSVATLLLALSQAAAVTNYVDTLSGSFTGNGAGLTGILASAVSGVVTNGYVPVLTLNGGLLLSNLTTGSWIRETNGIITAGGTNGTANITLNGNSGNVIISGTSSTIGGNVLPGWSGTGPFVGGRLLMDANGNGSVIKTTGIDVTNPAFQGTLTSTNGFASFATNRVAIAATGYTNTMTVGGQAVNVDVLFTAATATLSDTNGTTIHVYTTLGTSDLYAPMKPGWRLVGTTMAGDVIVK